jgi:hypothetical protein
LDDQPVVLEVAKKTFAEALDWRAGFAALDIGLPAADDWVVRIPLREVDEDVAVFGEQVLATKFHSEGCRGADDLATRSEFVISHAAACGCDAKVLGV